MRRNGEGRSIRSGPIWNKGLKSSVCGGWGFVLTFGIFSFFVVDTASGERGDEGGGVGLG